MTGKYEKRLIELVEDTFEEAEKVDLQGTRNYQILYSKICLLRGYVETLKENQDKS